MTYRNRSLLMLPLLLAGCASGFPGARPLTYATPAEAHVYATGDKCIHEPNDQEFGGLIAAAVTGVASTLLKNFGSALAEGAKGGALPSSISTQNLQLDTGKIPKCLVIIRGAFQPTGDDPNSISDFAGYLGLPGDAADQRRRLIDLKLPAIYRVDHFIELRLGASNNSKALTFAPAFVKLAHSIDGATKGERDLSIAVKFNRLGADAVGSAVVLADRKIGSQTIWTVQDNGRFAIEAPWFGTFHAPPAPAGTTPTSAAAASAAKPAKVAKPAAPAGPVGGGGAGVGTGAIGGPPTNTPGSTNPSMQSDNGDATPVTVTATVVETRPANESLAFIATVFNGLEPKIEEKLKPLIDTDAASAADATAATASLGAQADYASAEGTARGALISYCSVSSVDATAAGKQDRITKSTAARAAQLKANVAAIKAELDQPYSSLIVISADLPSATVNAAQCSAL